MVKAVTFANGKVLRNGALGRLMLKRSVLLASVAS